MINVKVALNNEGQDNSIGNVLIRKIHNTDHTGLSKWAFVIVEFDKYGQVKYKNTGMVETFADQYCWSDLLHIVLSASKNHKALLPITLYEKSFISTMEAEVVCG